METEPNFPIECLEDIFRHLSAKDLLKCTLVCPDWNEFITLTRSCMGKIKLTSTSHLYVPGEIKNILMHSDRKYECLELKCSFYNNIQKFLLAKGRRWTHVDLKRFLAFATVSEFLEFLQIFQATVQKLVLSGEVKDDFLEEIKPGDYQLNFP